MACDMKYSTYLFNHGIFSVCPREIQLTGFGLKYNGKYVLHEGRVRHRMFYQKDGNTELCVYFDDLHEQWWIAKCRVRALFAAIRQPVFYLAQNNLMCPTDGSQSWSTHRGQWVRKAIVTEIGNILWLRNKSKLLCRY